MKQENIPIYNDPIDFNENSKYPCSSQFMVYNGLEHKYFLTHEALAYYGIDVERKYISDNPNKEREFIEKVTKKIYDYINYKSGWQNFQVQMYRIATAPTNIVGDKYAFRKQIEQILVSEAQWIIDNGDSAKYSANDLEKGKVIGSKPEETWRANDDIAPEAKRSLEFLGLSRWFTLAPNRYLNKELY